MTQTVILRGESQRTLAKLLIDRAPVDAVVDVSEARRTNDQNAKMRAMLSDVSRQVKMNGIFYSPEDWKCRFMDACSFKARWIPDLEGDGMINAGYRSSRLSKAQMSDVIEAMYEYGARHGVRWSDPAERKAA